MLHNFCIQHNILPANGYEIHDENFNIVYAKPLQLDGNRRNRINPELEAGRTVRQQILTNYFNQINGLYSCYNNM